MSERTALTELVQSFRMVLHEAVDQFTEAEYSHLSDLDEPARAELRELRAAVAERDKWRAWKPDDEDLADLKQQARSRDGSYTNGLTAQAIYIGALEARLRERDAAIERAVEEEREACAIEAEHSSIGVLGASGNDRRYKVANEIAAAIRARGEKGAK